MLGRLLNAGRGVGTAVLFGVWTCTWAPSLLADEQTGAERTKRVTSATISQAKGGEMYGDTPIGNVEVTYADGTKDLWTLKANCGLPHVATDGTVGWTVFEPERPAATASYSVRPNDLLILCRRGQVVTKIHSGLGYIEDWNFLADGKQVVLRTRALHGVAYIERHESATGRLIDNLKAYQENLPAWAQPFSDR